MEGNLDSDPYRAPPSPGTGRELLPLEGRSRAARLLLWLQVPVALAMALHAGLVLSGLLPAADPEGETFEAADFVELGLGCGFLAVYPATVAAFLAWLHRASSRVHAATGRARFSPAGSVGWWFVPIANLWLPFQAVRDLWRRSHLRGRTPVRSDRSLTVWWACWLASSLLDGASLRLYLRNPGSAAEHVLDLVSSGLTIAAAILAARMVRDLTAAQRESFGAP
jgi:hypothetical protein